MKLVRDSCPICSSSDFSQFSVARDVEYLSSHHYYEYMECHDCKCIYIKNPPTEALSSIYPDSYYSIDAERQTQNGLLNFLQKIKSFFDLKLFKHALSLMPNAPLRCIDVGGGSGWIMSMIRDMDTRVFKTTILDINIKSKEIAESNGHTFIHGVIESLNLKEEYDFALLLNLIEHVSDPKYVLTLLYDSLKPGGLLVIKTPNTSSLNRQLFGKRYWGGLHAPRHWVLFNRKNFTKTALEAGFSIAYFSYTQGAPQWSASIIGTYREKYFSIKAKPIHKTPLFSLLSVLFAAFDYVTLSLSRTDQMIFFLRKPS